MGKHGTRVKRNGKRDPGREPLLSNRQGIAASLAALLLLAGLGVLVMVTAPGLGR